MICLRPQSDIQYLDTIYVFSFSNRGVLRTDIIGTESYGYSRHHGLKNKKNTIGQMISGNCSAGTPQQQEVKTKDGETIHKSEFCGLQL